MKLAFKKYLFALFALMIFSVPTIVDALPAEPNGVHSFSSIIGELLESMNNGTQQAASNNNTVYPSSTSLVNGRWQVQSGSLNVHASGIQIVGHLSSATPSQFPIQMVTHPLGFAMNINNSNNVSLMFTITAPVLDSMPITIPGVVGHLQRVSPTNYLETHPSGDTATLELLNNNSTLRLTLNSTSGSDTLQMIINFSRVSAPPSNGGTGTGGGGTPPGTGGGGTTPGTGGGGGGTGCNAPGVYALAMLLILPLFFKKK